jgi:hypothetical protein
VRTTSGGGVFEDISFDGGSMVVRLREGHDVSQVNLIAPDGTSFAQATVPTGATTVRMKLLAIRQGSYLHYSLGPHKLVAVTDTDAISVDLDLKPDLEITEVSQPRSIAGSDDYGRLELRIGNTGTAPTWIYDITYQGAPNFSADTELSSQPGIPRLHDLETPDETIIPPGAIKSYIGAKVPLAFPGDDPTGCSLEEHRFSIRVGVASGDVLLRDVQASVSGEREPVGIVGEYVCTDVSIGLVDESGVSGRI